MKEKLLSFIKGKQFYYVLLIGFVAIFSIASLIYSNNNKRDEKVPQEVVDLNTPLEGEDEGGDVVLEPAVSEGLDEPEEIVSQPPSIVTEEVVGDETQDTELDEDTTQETEEVANESSDVLVPTSGGSLEVVEEEVPQKLQETFLVFNVASGMSWPVEGSIILPYSMNHAIYFETLDQYKFFSAVAIQAMVGTEVTVAANGVVEAITQDEETGQTVIVDHGNGYKSIYGQLKDIQVKIGDQVEQGVAIGVVGTPTIYYSKEGSHLYFKVLKDNQSINPESVLKE